MCLSGLLANTVNSILKAFNFPANKNSYKKKVSPKQNNTEINLSYKINCITFFQASVQQFRLARGADSCFVLLELTVFVHEHSVSGLIDWTSTVGAVGTAVTSEKSECVCTSVSDGVSICWGVSCCGHITINASSLLHSSALRGQTVQYKTKQKPILPLGAQSHSILSAFVEDHDVIAGKACFKPNANWTFYKVCWLYFHTWWLCDFFNQGLADVLIPAVMMFFLGRWWLSGKITFKTTSNDKS